MKKITRMNMLHIHGTALDGEIAAYHEFLLYYKANAHIVYGFVEGKQDPAFYRSVIQSIICDDWRVCFIRAGNKDKVLRTLRNFDWMRFERQRICFFVDKVLSELLGVVHETDGNLYVTDNYAIENEIVTTDTLVCVLEDMLNITKWTPEEREEIERLFESNLRSFKEIMAPVMAQILLWKRSGARPCLDEIDPRSFVYFDCCEIQLRTEFQDRTARVAHAGKCVHTQGCSVPLTSSGMRGRDLG